MIASLAQATRGWGPPRRRAFQFFMIASPTLRESEEMWNKITFNSLWLLRVRYRLALILVESGFQFFMIASCGMSNQQASQVDAFNSLWLLLEKCEEQGVSGDDHLLSILYDCFKLRCSQGRGWWGRHLSILYDCFSSRKCDAMSDPRLNFQFFMIASGTPRASTTR